MDGTALVICDGYFETPVGKTAHGLVRGTDRYRVVGVIDSATAGRDARALVGPLSSGVCTSGPDRRGVWGPAGAASL